MTGSGDIASEPATGEGTNAATDGDTRTDQEARLARAPARSMSARVRAAELRERMVKAGKWRSGG